MISIDTVLYLHPLRESRPVRHIGRDFFCIDAGRLPVNQRSARSRLQKTCQNFDQSRLSGAVRRCQCYDFSSSEVKIYLIQCFDLSKAAA